LIVRVFEGGPAEKAGLKQGDVVLTVDHHPVGGKSDYLQRLAAYAVDNQVELGVLRDGARQAVKVSVSVIPRRHMPEFTQNWLGIAVKPVTQELVGRYKLSTQKGMLIVDVDQGGVSGRIGIRPGDVILQVNQTAINSEDDFYSVVSEAASRSTVLFLIQRGINGYYVTLEP
jgi:serine protease Do